MDQEVLEDQADQADEQCLILEVQVDLVAEAMLMVDQVVPAGQVAVALTHLQVGPVGPVVLEVLADQEGLVIA